MKNVSNNIGSGERRRPPAASAATESLAERRRRELANFRKSMSKSAEKPCRWRDAFCACH